MCKVIIDTSVIAYKNWHRMGSDNYVSTYEDELSEFTLNMYTYVLYIVTRFKPTELIFAMDSRQPWRNVTYENWYIKHSKLYQLNSIEIDEEGNVTRVLQKEYIAKYDQKVVKYFFHDGSQDWKKKKMTVAMVKEIDWDSYVNLDDMTNEEFNLGFAEEYKTVKKAIKGRKKAILYGTLKKLFPKYKGGRSQAWDYKTPKNGFTDENGQFIAGFRELTYELVTALAGTFKGKVVSAENAEGDDIIAHYVKNSRSADDLIVISVDTDLHHLYLDNLFFKYFNPNFDEMGNRSAWGGFVDLNKKKVLYDLRKKLLMGDSSDNINACSHYEIKKGEKLLKSGCIGKKTADTMLVEMKLTEILETVEPTTFNRNRQLIHLDNIPDKINALIKKEFKKAKIPEYVSHKEYNCTPRKRLQAKRYALVHSQMVVCPEDLIEEINEENCVTSYEEMSKEDLIQYIQSLETDLNQTKTDLSFASAETAGKKGVLT